MGRAYVLPSPADDLYVDKSNVLAAVKAPNMPTQSCQQSLSPAVTAVNLVQTPDERTVRSVNAVSLNTVDHKAMEKAQSQCPEVMAQVNGKHVNGMKIKKVEFSPNIFLHCDVSNLYYNCNNDPPWGSATC